MSAAGDNSVVAYIEDDGKGAGTYKLTIGANEKIIANPNMTSYFDSYLFKNLETIDLSYLDTSKVINMTNMFGSLNASVSAALPLTELDLSNFDTRNVTNMSSMFTGLSNLQNIIFGENFDTSNVTNMSSMFYYLSGIESIDVSGFDTSNVIYMSDMFSRCEKLKELDLTNFDNSKVVTMEEMFWSTSSLTKVLVSDKWIVNEGTNINGMFTNSGVNQVTKA